MNEKSTILSLVETQLYKNPYTKKGHLADFINRFVYTCVYNPQFFTTFPQSYPQK